MRETTLKVRFQILHVLAIVYSEFPSRLSQVRRLDVVAHPDLLYPTEANTRPIILELTNSLSSSRTALNDFS
jgi:hypothetical protein